MSTHDTPEAVEAVVDRVHDETNGGGMLRWCDPRVANEAAAMLRRLHARAVDAERFRDAYRSSEAEVLAENDALRFERNNLRATLATARADALREAADYVRRKGAGQSLAGQIEALANKDPRHD